MSNRERIVPFLVGAVTGAVVVLFLTGLEGRTGTGSSTGTSGSSFDESEVVARIGREQITLADLRTAQPEAHLQIDRERQDLYEAGLDRLMAERLVEKEADSRGISEEELINQEVDAKLSDPTDAEVDEFFQRNQARVQGTREQLDAPIRQFLRRQQAQAGFDALIAELEEKYEAESFLEPFRFEVNSSGFPSKGAEDAAVTIVEFSDFECPFCLRVVPTLDRILEDYGDDVRLVFRQFPLNNIHPNAQNAAEASLCAADQSRFWQYHDALFAAPGGLDRESLRRTASDIGLDTDAFDSCLDSRRHSAAVDADLEAGRMLGITGTPALFINGRFLSGAQPYEVISAIIDDELRRSGA